MAKKKRSLMGKAKGFQSPAQSKLATAKQFTIKDAKMRIAQGHWYDAKVILENLAQKSPQRSEIWTDLLVVYEQLDDLLGAEQACGHLVELNPDNAEVKLVLAEVYLRNGRPILAIQCFQEVLDHYPDHEDAPTIQSTLATLQTMMTEVLAELGLSGEEAVEIAALHERLLSNFQQNNFSAAYRLGEDLLNRQPNFVPALNNLSMIDFFEGQIDQAVARSKQVLEIDPQNIHALANLVHYLYISARPEEARVYADRLQTVHLKTPEAYIKQAEALTYLGDDQTVLKLVETAQATNIQEGLLCHYAGVAALRLNQPQVAKHYWQQAVKLMPSLRIAQENLADLEKPIGDRHAPFAFGLPEWFPKTLVQPLLDAMAHPTQPIEAEDQDASTVLVREYLDNQPILEYLIPILLERGDSVGRGFALNIARFAQTPTTLNYLMDFALSQAGPDQVRHEAAIAAQNGGLITENPVKLWIQGKWQEIYLMNFEITEAPTVVLPPKVERLSNQAFMLLQRNEGEKAEALLKQALELHPDDPSLLNNLAMAYSLQDRTDEAMDLIRDIHARYPDYVLARLSMAKSYVQDGELEAADDLVKPLFLQRRFHISEFVSLCETQICILFAKGNREGAQQWLGMWEQVARKDPRIRAWRQRLTR